MSLRLTGLGTNNQDEDFLRDERMLFPKNRQTTTPQTNMEKTTYLGDSVYAERTNGGIEIFLNNGERNESGLEKKSLIYLEPSVVKALFEFAYPEPTPIVPSTIPEVKHIDERIQDAMGERNIAIMVAKLLEGYTGKKRFSIGSCHTVDFDYYTREEMLPLMEHLKGGKWEKHVIECLGKMTYENSTILPAPWKMRFWAGDPPPSCRIEPYEVEIPEETKVIPARKEKRFKVICTEETPAPAEQTAPTETPAPVESNEKSDSPAI